MKWYLYDQTGYKEIDEKHIDGIRLNIQLKKSTEALHRCDDPTLYKFSDGAVISKTNDELLAEKKITKEDWLNNEIRPRRNALLIASDKYILPDYPINGTDLVKAKAYRQALRDLPATATAGNVVWPVDPEGA